LEREVQVRRRREYGGRAERTGVLASGYSVANAHVAHVIRVHVRRQRTIIVLERDVAAAAAIEPELAELDADHGSRGHGHDWPTARTVEIDAAMALAALGPLDAIAACAKVPARLVRHQLAAPAHRGGPSPPPRKPL